MQHWSGSFEDELRLTLLPVKISAERVLDFRGILEYFNTAGTTFHNSQEMMIANAGNLFAIAQGLVAAISGQSPSYNDPALMDAIGKWSTFFSLQQGRAGAEADGAMRESILKSAWGTAERASVGYGLDLSGFPDAWPQQERMLGAAFVNSARRYQGALENHGTVWGLDVVVLTGRWEHYPDPRRDRGFVRDAALRLDSASNPPPDPAYR